MILYTLANAFNLTVMLQKYNDRACVLCQHEAFGVASCCSTCALTNDLSYVTEKQNFLERLSLETERIFYVRPELFTFSTFTCRAVNPPRLLMGSG